MKDIKTTKDFFTTKSLKNSKNIKYIVFFDTETTDTQENGYVIQNAPALYSVNFNKKEMRLISYFEENIKPRNAISPAAATVHGLWYDDFENAPTWEDSLSKQVMQESIDRGYYLCAHNSDFDTAILAKENLIIPKEQVIDTLAIARAVNINNDEITSNSLQWLRYFYDFDRNEDFVKFINEYGIKKLIPHTALSDIAVLAYYFKYLLINNKLTSIEEAIHLTRAPLIEDKVTFGNVIPKGMSIRDAVFFTYEQYGRKKNGLDYLNWAINNMTFMSAGMRISISKHIIDLVKEGKLSELNNSIVPMKFIAATFCPEHKDFLNSIGFSVENASDKTMERIHEKINELRNSDDENLDTRELTALDKLVQFKEYIG